LPQGTVGRAARLAALALAGYVVSAGAQQPPLPDAGRIQEQLRPPEPPRKPAPAEIRIQRPPGDPKVQTPPVHVASFRVRGATVFPEADLQRLLGEPRRSMTLAELQTLVERINEHYRRHGYLVARAIIPPQDVRDGVVEVRVVEGRYERIEIANASEMSEARIRATVGALREDAVVHGPTLERSVLLLSDLAGIQPKATLEPAAQPGYTNLMMEIVPTRPYDFDATVDNGGSRFTGRYRLSAGASWNSPRQIGDRATLRYVTSGEKLNSLRLGYETPVGTSGLRANAFGAYTPYELGEDFEDLDATGWSRSFGAGLGYPVIRSSDLNLRAQVGAEHRALKDRIGAFEIENEKRLAIVQWGATGDFRDALLGGAISAFQALVSNGKLNLRSPGLVETDQATARAEGNFYKAVLGFQRQQRIAEPLRLTLNYTAQVAGDNLDSSEKFSVGGLTGVRAYPPGEAAGDDVHFAQAELRYSAGAVYGGQLTPVAFFDYAQSRINHRTWEGFTGDNFRELAGWGAGLEWTLTGQYFARGWYARKIGNEPATADRDRKDRVWLQAGVLF
jgi:hemolysin activation/secretion protein